MPKRREDVEEVLRLKSNPFPDGTLEAPEFPRQVYTTNVVQAVTSQMAAQTDQGPKLITAHPAGYLNVTVPPETRLYRKVKHVDFNLSSPIGPGTGVTFTTIPETNTIYSIMMIDFQCQKPSGATYGVTTFDLFFGYMPLAIMEAFWYYNEQPTITHSLPEPSNAGDYPPSGELWQRQLFTLRFDSTYYIYFQIMNGTDGTIPANPFEFRVYYFIEEY
jgi:hypothetical protein